MKTEIGKSPTSTKSLGTRKRVILQYRLSTLLAAMIVAAVISAWFGALVRQRNREQIAMDAIESHNDASFHTWNIEPAWIQRSVGNFQLFERVLTIYIANDDFLDDSFRHVLDFEQLIYMVIDVPVLTNANLDTLVKCKRLFEVDFGNVEIDFNVAKAINECGELRRVMFDGCTLTPQAIQCLAQNERLEELRLYYCDLSDDDVFALGSIQSLKVMDITGSEVPASVIKELLARRPLLEIVDP